MFKPNSQRPIDFSCIKYTPFTRPLFILFLLLSIGCQCTQVLAQEFDAEILSNDTKVYFIGVNLYKDTKVSVRINKRDGDVYSLISIPYSSMLEVTTIEGEVRNSNGKILKTLKEKDINSISATSAEAFYDDQMIYYFNLKHDNFPYTITYSYTSKQQSFINICDWSPVLALEIPCYKATLEVSIPRGKKVACRTKNIEPALITETEDLTTYTWSGKYTEILQEDIFSPPLQELTPFVSVIPERFIYDIPGSTKSWAEFGDWISKLNDGLQSLKSEDKEKILDTRRGIKDQTT